MKSNIDSEKDDEISVDIVILDENGGRPALNAALNTSLADVVVFSGPEGGVNVRALPILATAFSDPEVMVAYSDESVVDSRGRHLRSIYKPDWSPERLRSHFYLGNILAVRRYSTLQSTTRWPRCTAPRFAGTSSCDSPRTVERSFTFPSRFSEARNSARRQRAAPRQTC
jgi:hypothetical protein